MAMRGELQRLLERGARPVSTPEDRRQLGKFLVALRTETAVCLDNWPFSPPRWGSTFSFAPTMKTQDVSTYKNYISCKINLCFLDCLNKPLRVGHAFQRVSQEDVAPERVRRASQTARQAFDAISPSLGSHFLVA